VFAGAPGQSRITGRKKNKMIQVRASQAKRPFLSGEHYPGVRPEIFTAFVTCRFSTGDEYLELFIPLIL
jgi:hypothetical protein